MGRVALFRHEEVFMPTGRVLRGQPGLSNPRMKVPQGQDFPKSVGSGTSR